MKAGVMLLASIAILLVLLQMHGPSIPTLAALDGIVGGICIVLLVLRRRT